MLTCSLLQRGQVKSDISVSSGAMQINPNDVSGKNICLDFGFTASANMVSHNDFYMQKYRLKASSRSWYSFTGSTKLIFQSTGGERSGTVNRL